MKEATIVYPHQLYKNSPALQSGRAVYLVEEALLLTHNPIHMQKLMFHKLSMDTYQQELEQAGYIVKRLEIQKCPKTADVFEVLKKDGISIIHVVDTTDYYLEQALHTTALERVWYESPLFILDKGDAKERYVESKRFMASFYKQLRKDKNILIDESGEPTGGKWSFDEENRKKLPKNISLPEDIALEDSGAVAEATSWVKTLKAEVYGEAGCWVPYTRKEARKYLNDFLNHRLADFGTYEDALSVEGTRLFHSTLSPLINVGLLSPQEVIDETLNFAAEHNSPLNSVEGFVRQVLGWREFIRAAYEHDGVAMRTKNFWHHDRPLPPGFWTAETGIEPLDISIEKALSHGYNHHIERLMVLGNFLLLTKTDPDEVYRWFMGMYVDAYDWVMVPNVYGMSQFADGGLFATKPYISGSNYLKKMSDYPKGGWEETWTALYWNFIDSHKDFFISNHRLSMMPRILEKMDIEKKNNYLKAAKAYLSSNS